MYNRVVSTYNKTCGAGGLDDSYSKLAVSDAPHSDRKRVDDGCQCRQFMAFY